MPFIRHLPRHVLPALVILLVVAGCFSGTRPLSASDREPFSPEPFPPGEPGPLTSISGTPPVDPPQANPPQVGGGPAGPSIAVDPLRSLNDAPVSIRLSGLTPGQTVTLHANLADTYSSYASFVADDDGSVDLAQQAPLAGSYYTQPDPMGLIWNAQVSPGVGARSVSTLPDSYPVTFTLQAGAETLASTTITRVFMDEGVTRREVNEDGLIGTYFRPAGPGPFPALILTGGSDLDPHYHTAAALASRGCAALALSYYGQPGLPNEMSLIPLEYFEKAIAWLQAQDGVAGERLGAMGWSAGGQLALLLGATFPQIKSVVAYVPAGVVSEGTLKGDFSGESRYTFHGRPLDYVYGVALIQWDAAYRPIRAVEADPQAALDATLAGIDLTKFGDAVIPVENTQGPVLLISAVDDDSWPSALLAEIAMRRLREAGHPFPDQHLMYEDSGHFIGTPYGPARPDASLGVERIRKYGPSLDGTDRASADSWPRVLQFLADSLK